MSGQGYAFGMVYDSDGNFLQDASVTCETLAIDYPFSGTQAYYCGYGVAGKRHLLNIAYNNQNISRSIWVNGSLQQRDISI